MSWIIDAIILIFVVPPSQIFCKVWKRMDDEYHLDIDYPMLFKLGEMYDNLDAALRSSYLRVGRFPHGMAFFMMWMFSLVLIGLIFKYIGLT